ncbi:MAG: CvpA family protein [Chloroflexota bacterium]
MMQLTMFMGFLAAFFGVLGYLRGWQKEMIALVGIILVQFALFRFDPFLRTLLFGFDPQQLFLVEFLAFIAVVFLVYQAEQIGGGGVRSDDDLQEGLIGSLFGAANGYLIGGGIWYFLDIHNYPFDQFVTAPAAGSPSAQALGWMPMMILGGGADGTGGLLSIGVLVLVFVVLITI